MGINGLSDSHLTQGLLESSEQTQRNQLMQPPDEETIAFMGKQSQGAGQCYFKMLTLSQLTHTTCTSRYIILQASTKKYQQTSQLNFAIQIS